MKLPDVRSTWRIVILYALFSGAWILVSDRLIVRYIGDPSLLTQVQTYKGWGFIVITAVLLHVLLIRELNRREHVEVELRKSEERLRTVISNAPVCLWALDRWGIITLSEGKGLEGLGIKPGEHVGLSVFDLYPDVPQILENNRRALNGETFNATVEVKGLFFECWYSPIRASSGEITGAIGVATDITGRRQAEETIKYQAYYDALTDLPNHTLFHDRLQQAILTAQREDKPVAVLIIDLDRFKEIINTLGYQLGDLVLKEVGYRLRGTVRKSDTVARLEGDKFAMLLPSTDGEGASLVSRQIQKALEEPFILEGLTLQIEASIGIALFPKHAEEARGLMRCAEVAMYLAKGSSSDYLIYNTQEDPYSTQRLVLMGELRDATQRNQLFMLYQPKINLKTHSVVGVEALVRWKHPRLGLIPPDQFIPLAERTGLIKPLTLWVIHEVLRQCRAWQDAGIEISVAVNLSRRNLHDPLLPDQVAEALKIYSVSPEQLEMEITEGAIMANVTSAIGILTRLRKVGLQLSIDDFGTGYSSLGSLKKLPVNALKIDKSFVIDMAKGADDAVIVRSTIDLAHNLCLKVIAEGVENRETWDRLAAMGCDIAQGYYISRPIPADELTRWMNGSSWAQKKITGDMGITMT